MYTSNIQGLGVCQQVLKGPHNDQDNISLPWCNLPPSNFDNNLIKLENLLGMNYDAREMDVALVKTNICLYAC